MNTKPSKKIQKNLTLFKKYDPIRNILYGETKTNPMEDWENKFGRLGIYNQEHREDMRIIKDFIHSLLKQERERIEKLEVQLAGCGVAALGGTKEPAKKGDFGWSASYQDVLDLRIKYDSQKSEMLNRVEEEMEKRQMWIRGGSPQTLTPEAYWLGVGFDNCLIKVKEIIKFMKEEI